MSEETEIPVTHLLAGNKAACGPVTSGAIFTGEPSRVTCGACKLEQPMQSVPGRVEYRTPEHVLATDASFTDPPLAEIRSRRLHAVRASEEFALATMQYWAKVWRKAVILRREVERGSGVAPEGSEINSAQIGSRGAADAFWMIYTEGPNEYALRHAPVNAVDIRTDVEETEGMSGTKVNEVIARLSKRAQSALVDTQGVQGRIVSCPPDIFLELHRAELIGIGGGLTRYGTIVRAKIVQAREDAAFG